MNRTFQTEGTERTLEQKNSDSNFKIPAGATRIHGMAYLPYIPTIGTSFRWGFHPSPDLVGTRLPMPSCHLWRMCHWRTLSWPQLSIKQNTHSWQGWKDVVGFFFGDVNNYQLFFFETLLNCTKKSKKQNWKNWEVETTLDCIFFRIFFRFEFANAYFIVAETTLWPSTLFGGKGWVPSILATQLRHTARVLHDKESLEKRLSSPMDVFDEGILPQNRNLGSIWNIFWFIPHIYVYI